MNTDNLVAYSRARFDHAAAKRLLKEKYEAKMLFAHAGGMWQAGPELLTLLLACAQNKDIVILDLYNNPIKVTVTDLFAEAHARWQEQMNAWLVEHSKLQNQK